MAALFPEIGSAGSAPKTYQEFWNGLDRDTARYEYYRGHQLKILEEYETIDPSVKDVALCLPTGTGKTIIGLSIARYRQLQERARVLWLCPTIQLCSQVLDEANSLGIPAVPLYQAWDSLAPQDVESYQAGDAIGVATYWTLFNSSPKTGTPTVLVFDDIHAAADAVLNPWELRVSATSDPDLFAELKAALSTLAPPDQLTPLSERAPPENQITLVAGRHWLQLVDVFQEAIERHAPTSDLRHAWRRVSGRLENCFCFLTPGIITIRPWTPPTFDLQQFNGVERRIYLSATLDQWGHLEHITGIESAERLTQDDVQVPGRRLILNLDKLLPAKPELDRILFLAKNTKRVVILCRSLRDRNAVIEHLRGSDYEGQVFGDRALEADIRSLGGCDGGALVLGNRYDGLDLGSGLCDGIVLWRLPLAIGPQEEFVSQRWAVTAAAESRARQRIHQGIGRCTRRESDAAVVGLVGKDLTEFILRPAVYAALPRRIRAELELCGKIPLGTDVAALIRACASRDEEWRRVCAQMDALGAKMPEERQRDAELMKSHRREAGYSKHLWSRNYTAAADSAVRTAQRLTGANERAAAPWFYLAGLAVDIEQWRSTGSPFADAGTAHLREAIYRADGRAWFGALSMLTEPSSLDENDEPQFEGMVAYLNRFPRQTRRLEEHLDQMISDLEQAESGRYHRGLRSLGESLGLQATSPDRHGAPDVVWHLQGAAIQIFEAKTEKDADGELSVSEVRQIVNMPGEVRANENLAVDQSLLAICVTDVQRVAAEMVHDLPRFDVARPSSILEFARQWRDRLVAFHARHLPSVRDYRSSIQALLRQMRTTRDLTGRRMGVQRADKALKVPERPETTV